MIIIQGWVEPAQGEQGSLLEAEVGQAGEEEEEEGGEGRPAAGRQIQESLHRYKLRGHLTLRFFWVCNCIGHTIKHYAFFLNSYGLNWTYKKNEL